MSKPISSEKKEQWEDFIRQQQASELSVRRWCHENQIIETSFRYWKNRLYPKPLKSSCFTELSDTPTGTGISIEYRGIRIHIDKCFDRATLKTCLSILKEVLC